MAWQPPAAFDDYRVIRPLGEGAMGRVYLAHDLALDRQVAIKVVSAPDSAKARERFFIEARAVARLQHPNVLAVHRVGEVDGHPYLVSEYLRGTPLKLLSLPLAEAQVLEFGIELARGLAAAHRKGVLHRDIKPANVMLTEDGHIKLLDFGLAKLPDDVVLPIKPAVLAPPPSPALPRSGPDDTLPSSATPLTPTEPPSPESAELTQAGTILGSPLYMPPEAWRAEPPSPQGDIYSLGVVLYELASGAAPGAHVPLAQLPMYSQTAEPKPIRAISNGLFRVIQTCLRCSRVERYASAEQLLEALEALAAPLTASARPTGNPYRGLQAFDADHRNVFFGRDAETRLLVERVSNEPFVVVAGDSGVGKSSLCRAGVLPALSARGFETVALVTGTRPLVALTKTLASLLGRDEADVAHTLSSDALSLGRALRGRRVALFFDQFEEAITLTSAAERDAFCEALATLSLDSLGVHVLLAVRADFLGRMATLPRLGEPLSRTLTFVRPLAAEQLRRAIVGPCTAAGYSFEAASTVDRLVSAAQQSEGALPLLQFALSELWERRDEGQHLIPSNALDALGGLEGCLARYADSVIAALPRTHLDSARRVLTRLVTAEGTAGRVKVSEFELDAWGHETLNALVRGRLVLAREAADLGPSEYQLAHEALIHRWETLRDWLAGNAHERALRSRLQRAANEWQRLERTSEALWTSKQLAELAPLPAEGYSSHETAFLNASKRRVRARLWRRRALAVLVPSIVLLATLPLLKVRYDQARAREVYRQVAVSAAHDATARVDQAHLERLNAFAAFDAHANEAEALWNTALRTTRDAQSRLMQARSAFERALELDPMNPELVNEAGALLLSAVQFEESLNPGRRAQSMRDDLRARWPSFAARLDRPGVLSLSSRPSGARLTLQRYTLENERWVESAPLELGVTPYEGEIAPGSVVLTLSLEGHAVTRVAVLVDSAQTHASNVQLVRQAQVPADFVYVPEGDFLVGSADEDLRKSWLNAEPVHRRHTGAYLIAQHETTFADWLVFLRSLPQTERTRRLPNVQAFNKLSLEPQRDGLYRLTLEPSAVSYVAREGESIHYAARSTRAVQDWLRMPVAAITWSDARAYTQWLDATGRVPHARLCTDDEWERAGRGADGRSFPSAEKLSADDIDQDVTYGRVPGGYGPDEVGRHPASRSPFGVDDLSGNVWEWVTSNSHPATPVLRGGCWYMGDISALLTNREESTETHKDPLLGLRVCADAPSPP